MATRKAPQKRGRLSRTEVVTVRLDPKLRYLADLAARKQRRTVSSFIEWAVEHGLDDVRLADDDHSVWSNSNSLWDVEEADRFIKLATRYPDLLTHEEQLLWKLLKENGYCWRGAYDRHGDWTWNTLEKDVVIERVREHWETFRAAASGDSAAKKELPTWQRKGTSSATPKGKFDDMADDIPF
jgi:hypothetical protein